MTGERRLSGSVPSVSDARLASVLDTAGDGIIVIDERATILMFNKACEMMFGYVASEVLGRNVAMLMPAEQAERHDSYLSAYKFTGRRRVIGVGREVQGRRKDGSLFPLYISVGEAQTPEGPQFIGILRDLSTRHETERRLNELQSDLIRLARISALDEMGLALAHELNQPLTAVILYLQAASRELRREQQDSRAGAILDKARKEAQRAGAIIQRIRQLGEKRAPERRAVDLNAIVEDAVELTQIGHDRSVRIIRDYEAGLPLVEVDQVQIQQVVVNLMRNAFEALRDSKRGKIVVATRLDERGVLFSVTDNGPGIAPDRLSDLFQAFKTGKRSGMGLGLAISRTIVQSHGGEFLVDPGGGWRGARFVVRLPLRGEDVAPEERSRASVGAP
ncbi:MAG TPA: PAS domain S-box protein [Microvirga sp.]|jgi:two-component system sensor kinase FixL|nr:PAS domain S-box protein [Microvirga sp.]